VIQPKDLADFLDNIPLVKRAFMRFTLNYNTATTTITANTAPTLVVASINQLTGRTNSAAKNLMNGIGDVSSDVNKVNHSVQKVGKSIDTLIIYIDK
jgi:hypothetical protein